MFAILDYLIESSNNIDNNEKEQLKQKIKKIKSIIELNQVFSDINITFSEKELEVIKEGCIRLLHDNSNYGPKTNKIFVAFIK